MQSVTNRVRALWLRATTERASPREVALALGVGAFVGATPAIGLHGWIAVGSATVLRLNRLYSFVGSRVSSPVVLPFIVVAEIQVAHRVRCGEFIAMASPGRGADALACARGLVLDWCLGAIPVGLALGIVLGALGYGVTHLRLRRKLLRDPRSSSGSPQSGSLARPS